MTQKVHLLDVRWVVVEYELSQEVVVSSLSRVKLKADNGEGLAMNQTNMRESLERLR